MPHHWKPRPAPISPTTVHHNLPRILGRPTARHHDQPRSAPPLDTTINPDPPHRWKPGPEPTSVMSVISCRCIRYSQINAGITQPRPTPAHPTAGHHNLSRSAPPLDKTTYPDLRLAPPQDTTFNKNSFIAGLGFPLYVHSHSVCGPLSPKDPIRLQHFTHREPQMGSARIVLAGSMLNCYKWLYDSM